MTTGSTTGRFRQIADRFGPHIMLLLYTLIALFPIVLILINSFKSRKAIFAAPYLPPTSETFSLIGYATVFERSNFQWYFC
jgi:raffinose/stachyose/melibiose transport system permease protein